MRRTPSGAACLVLLLGLTGCLGATRYDARPEASGDRFGIPQALAHALHAEDPWKRELWRQEYARRVRAQEIYLESEASKREARAAFWRELGATAREVGSLYLQQRLASE